MTSFFVDFGNQVPSKHLLKSRVTCGARDLGVKLLYMTLCENKKKVEGITYFEVLVKRNQNKPCREMRSPSLSLT